MLGALFMATDMVGSPMTHRGVVLHGVLIGVLDGGHSHLGRNAGRGHVRHLIANAFVPQIDALLGRPLRDGEGTVMTADRLTSSRRQPPQRLQDVPSPGRGGHLVWAAHRQRLRAHETDHREESGRGAAARGVYRDAGGRLRPRPFATRRRGRSSPSIKPIPKVASCTPATTTAGTARRAGHRGPRHGLSRRDHRAVRLLVRKERDRRASGAREQRNAGSRRQDRNSTPRSLANFEALDVSLTEDGQRGGPSDRSGQERRKENPWQVDGITGATISSVAISHMLRDSAAEWVPRLVETPRQISTTREAADD